MKALVFALALAACGTRSMMFDDDSGADAGRADAKADACTNPVAFWPDIDRDGFGDVLAAPITACSQPANTVPNNRDCGDGDDRMRPDQVIGQEGPALGKTSGSPYDFDCNGSEKITNAAQKGSCALDQNTGMCVQGGGPGWLTMPTSCATVYPWLVSCSTVNACMQTNVEMRHPKCL